VTRGAAAEEKLNEECRKFAAQVLLNSGGGILGRNLIEQAGEESQPHRSLYEEDQLGKVKKDGGKGA